MLQDAGSEETDRVICTYNGANKAESWYRYGRRQPSQKLGPMWKGGEAVFDVEENDGFLVVFIGVTCT